MNKSEFKYTVGQLIEVLKQFPHDLPVVVSGYEDEYENFLPPKIATLKHVPDAPYYYGQFQIDDKTNKNTFKAVLLEREMR